MNNPHVRPLLQVWFSESCSETYITTVKKKTSPTTSIEWRLELPRLKPCMLNAKFWSIIAGSVSKCCWNMAKEKRQRIMRQISFTHTDASVNANVWMKYIWRFAAWNQRKGISLFCGALDKDGPNDCNLASNIQCFCNCILKSQGTATSTLWNGLV